MVNKEDILKKLEKIKGEDKKTKFLERVIKTLKDKELKKELQENLDDLAQEEIKSKEEFSVPQIKTEKSIENLEEVVKEESVKKEEKKYEMTKYEAKKGLYKTGEFFDELKGRLDRVGLLPNDMIFNDKNIKDIRIYMQKMDLPQQTIEKYIDRITDVNHNLYKGTKNVNMFDMEYEAE